MTVDRPTTYSLDWVYPTEYEKLQFPLSIDDLDDLVSSALYAERWDDALALAEIVRDARGETCRQFGEYGTYEREKLERRYGEAHGQWSVVLTIWHVMRARAERDEQAKRDRKRAREDKRYDKLMGIKRPRKGSRP